MWQDTVIAICQLFFVVAMIPTIRGKDKPALSTCIMNAILVSIITICLATLGLWVSAGTATAVGICWLILAVQKFRLKKS